VPELPEVETVVRDLRPLLVDRHFVAVGRTSSAELRRPYNDAWTAELIDRRIQAVQRRGKWIVLELDNASFLVVHLGMTGQLTVVRPEEPLASHTHLIFALDDGQQLRYRDIRRFGSVTWHTNATALEQFFAEVGLGPEPFGVDADYWRQTLAGTTRLIKAVLLDQTVIAGVGNIYADEALHQARLHPKRRACELTSAEANRLRKAVEQVLTRAIERRGSTIRNYVGGSGLAGGYQAEFRVYGRGGEPCTRCKTPLTVLRVAGRSSHFCPRCQPAEPRSADEKV
jgi:formamidopyrimidine-DNA glycosylase